MTLNQQLDLASQVCAGLSAIHARGIIHRDIKPANIWIEPDAHVKLLDFGIAKLESTALTRSTNDIAGSASYMSPEQLSGNAVDYRGDILSGRHHSV